MSKREQRYDNLPKHQKRIILCLAREGPLIIMETNKKIKGEYTSTNRAFHELESKQLIRKVGAKSYRGREFPRYWLTMLGQVAALFSNSNVQDVKFYALELAKEPEERKDLELFYEIATNLGPETLNKVYRFILKRGKFELSFLPIEETELDKFFTILKKYPKYMDPVKATLRKALSYE